MQANSWHRKLFHLNFFFESWKCGNEGKKLQNSEYLENENSFLDELKSIVDSFEKAIK